MEGFNEGNERRMKIIRIIFGSLIFLLGVVFMFLPFIPLGYLFIFIGLFFLSPIIPHIRKLLNLIERKDKKGRIRKARDKSDWFEKRIDEDIEKLKKRKRSN